MYEPPNQEIDVAQRPLERLLVETIPRTRTLDREVSKQSQKSKRARVGVVTNVVPVPPPTARRLRGYAFDPSLSIALETAVVNEITFKVKWEQLLHGPVGEYLEVVDYDPASGCFYLPVDLDNPLIIAQDGLPLSEGNPQFHQQMVYAVAMTTIRNFELALGRYALWAPHFQVENGQVREARNVLKLRIYPHALREANAYYSPQKKALLFGYFPATPVHSEDHFPGGMVFTCLSHDIIAHETTHALLDGMHRHFATATNPDVLAFHEAFADIVALFQRFTFPEVLRHQIARTRGSLENQNLLGELAQQFGKATGQYGALRSAIGKIDKETKQWKPLTPDPTKYQTELEPHARGAILVAAVFDAFLSIYKNRVTDLLRIATGGTGELAEGALHPDLVNRLAGEAAKSAEHVLGVCIRALDYCPPVDITFGDYLRAIITADYDLVPDDDRRYRVAFIEAFRRRGIYPRDVRTLSEESLRWPEVREEEYEAKVGATIEKITKELRAEELNSELNRDRSRQRRTSENISPRQVSFDSSSRLAGKLHNLIRDHLSDLPTRLQLQLMGLVLSNNGDVDGFSKKEITQVIKECARYSNGTRRQSFHVYAVRFARRVGPDGRKVNHVVISLTQTREFDSGSLRHFRGGCTLILNLDTFDLKYSIVKPVLDMDRDKRQRTYRETMVGSRRATYFGDDDLREPFALLHRDYDTGGLL
jgi:hypothetical protein